MNPRPAMSSPMSLQEIIADVVKPVSPGKPRQSRVRIPALVSASVPSTSRSSSPTVTPPASPPDYALFIAIDWADTAHERCTWNPATQQRTHETLSHTPTALHA